MANDLDIVWSTEQRKISDLVPYPNNPRRLTEKQKTDLQKSIERFNLAEIPAINVDGTILAGHQRLKILASLGRGEETIDVRVPSRVLTPTEMQEYNIRSNQNTGEWDFDLLADEFGHDDLIEWGFEEGEILRPDFDPIEEEPPRLDQKKPTVCPECGHEWTE
jgi:ParB-like chromosome segregation protein Spo0J